MGLTARETEEAAGTTGSLPTCGVAHERMDPPVSILATRHESTRKVARWTPSALPSARQTKQQLSGNLGKFLKKEAPTARGARV